MKITVRLFATLRQGRGKEKEIDVGPGATPRCIAQAMGIEETDIAILLINGRDGPLDGTLAEGDRVSIFPPVGGG